MYLQLNLFVSDRLRFEKVVITTLVIQRKRLTYNVRNRFSYYTASK